MTRISVFHFGLQTPQKYGLVLWYSHIDLIFPPALFLFIAGLYRVAKAQQKSDSTPYFQLYGRREQLLASHPCAALVLRESWCLAVMRKQLAVNKECLLTGRSGKFKVEPLPWLRKMHSLLGEGSGWCPATAKNVLYRSVLSCTLLPFSFPLRSRSAYQWWGQWRVESGVAASRACGNAANAKHRSSRLIGVIRKHIILEFMCVLHHISSLKS